MTIQIIKNKEGAIFLIPNETIVHILSQHQQPRLVKSNGSKNFMKEFYERGVKFANTTKFPV